ncbi:hypothetical protein Phep_4133 [Pedobacter heparinus DSM 2366]|uniref:Alkyl hydroperoxide reductase subunit C/ Thiol specific antioxidant domain-containing protein n=2 Tax=Pedobacter heparinus TaxID=984 RepID=C6XWN5_PEDHD|nr:hypothetical protein Phep_4133 [Pedobacter heparinus DSM 2366]
MLAVTIISACTCIAIYLHFQVLRSENQTRTNRLEALNQIFTHNFQNFNRLVLRYANTKVPSNAILVDSNGKESEFRDLFGSGKRIVFYFSERNCDVCVKSELRKLKNMIARDIMIERSLLVISKYNLERSLKAFKISNKFDFEIYNVRDDGLLNDVGSPFYFIIDKEYLYKEMLFPFKDLPNITEMYINEMKKKYLTQVKVH